MPPELLVGVISDTHGLLRPEAVDALRDSDLIVHAGDVGSPQVLEALVRIAPVYAVRGNVDIDLWAEDLPLNCTVEAGQALLYVLHDVKRMKDVPAGVQAVLFGHSHKPSIEIRAGVLYLNPGNAGPRRFRLPASVARIRVRGTTLEPELVDLADEG